MIRAALLALFLLPGAAAAESLTLAFVPHPRHETVVAGEMVPVTLRAVYDRKVARQGLEIAPSESFDWIQTTPEHWKEEMIDGKSWIVMERGLALVPKRAGVLHFGPATHDMTIIDEKAPRQERTVVAPPLVALGRRLPGRARLALGRRRGDADRRALDRPRAARRRRDRHPARDAAGQGDAARGAAAAARSSPSPG